MKKLFLILIVIGSCLSIAAESKTQNFRLDGTSVIVRSSDGAEIRYKGDFYIIKSGANPHKQLRRGDFGYVMKDFQTQGLLYNVPTWGKIDNFVVDPNLHIEDGYNPEMDRAYGEGRTANYFLSAPGKKVSATGATKKGNTVEWIFNKDESFQFSAVLDFATASGLPKLTFTFIPKEDAWYSIGYIGAPETDSSTIDEIWQPHIWSEKRFPNQPFLSESFRATIPTALMNKDGITNGVVADPKYIPFTATPPTSSSSQFGVMIRNARGYAQSIVFAPVLGNKDSRMKAGEVFSFDLYLFQKKASLLDSFQEIAYDICGFGDIRRNSTCNLNTTIENTIEYCLSPYAMFVDSLRGCNYSTDVPGAVKNISGLHPLEFAILTDDEHIFRRMARPMLEYGLSRERFLFSTNDKVKGQGTSSRLNGPGVPVTDLLESYVYTLNRSDYFLSDAKRLYDGKVARSLNLDFMSYEDRWLNSLALYRATGDKQYLETAKKDADKYLESRVYNKQTNFDDKYSLGLFFWTSFTNQWMELLWLYELTGEKRYLDAAHEGARYYTQFCWITPTIPNGTITVNPGGVVPKYRNNPSKFVYMKMAEEDVEAWKVSEIGLTPESSGTSAGHRAIFMAHHAPFMMRIAALTGDKFLHDMARNAVVGRYEAFPGYHINAGRTNAFERKDFAFRSQKELNGHTSIHYNHPQSQVAMLWDYLFSDFYYVSGRAIDFPVEYSEGYAYCRSFIYGARPGHFYGDSNVYPYLPAGLLSSSNIQANYICGYGNNKLYVAFSNQSKENIRTTIKFNPEKSFIDPAITYTAQVWKQNRKAGTVTIRNASVDIDIKGEGISAIIIDDVDVKTSFQKKIQNGREKWAKNFTHVGFENDRAVILDFGPELRNVYVWNEANNSVFSRTILHYAIDGKWSAIEKTSYPYEYSIELPEDASEFRYFFESYTPAGEKRLSRTGVLYASESAARHIQRGPLKDSYVNPLPLPEYPLGNWTQKPSPSMDRWLKGYVQDFRELADPSAMYYDGKWYLYPSVSMAYVSEDFKTWKHVRIQPEKIGDGYAPSVVHHNGKFYMVGCFAGLYVSDSPLGPFKELGPITKPDGTSISDRIFDPMIFSDNGELYLYYHAKGLYGTKLNKKNPTRMDIEPILLAVPSRDHEWERYGEYNEDPRRSFMEGVWMFKNKDRYYLTFTSPGTANSTYAIGAYYGSSPLGPFQYQKRNPVLRKNSGVVPGSGHGSIVEGPNHTLWAFVTSTVGNYHVFERRVGLYPIGIDEDGELYGVPYRDVPLWAPGISNDPCNNNETGYLPVSVRTIATASSCAEGRTADYAIDDYCRSWWEPSAEDSAKELIVDFKNIYFIAAVRLMWAEPNLDHRNGICPGAVKYQIYTQPRKGDKWDLLVDCSSNEEDYLIDYKTFDLTKSRRIKLVVLGAAPGAKIGVSEITVFGKASEQ